MLLARCAFTADCLCWRRAQVSPYFMLLVAFVLLWVLGLLLLNGAAIGAALFPRGFPASAPARFIMLTLLVSQLLSDGRTRAHMQHGGCRMQGRVMREGLGSWLGFLGTVSVFRLLWSGLEHGRHMAARCEVTFDARAECVLRRCGYPVWGCHRCRRCTLVFPMYSSMRVVLDGVALDVGG